MDREMLVKLLNLSTSPEDGEALNAIRRANQMLKKANLTWDEYIRRAPWTQAQQRKHAQRQQEQKQRQEEYHRQREETQRQEALRRQQQEEERRRREAARQEALRQAALRKEQEEERLRKEAQAAAEKRKHEEPNKQSEVETEHDPESTNESLMESGSEPKIAVMFDFLLHESQECAGNRANYDFVKSVFSFWRRGDLSEKQEYFIKKYYYKYYQRIPQEQA